MEGRLFRLSLVTAILGIIGLYVISQTIELPAQHISEVVDGRVRLVGKIYSIKEFGNTTILKIHQDELIDVKMFDVKYTRVMNFTRGDKVELIGDALEYDDETEIVAKLVRKI